MSKINKILLGVIIILLVALGILLYWQNSKESYYAVYLNSGDVYFGKLSRFPRLTLSDVWLLRRDENNPQSPFSLSKFDKAFWGPQDKMYLNLKNIIWMTELKDDSQVLKTMNNPLSEASAQNVLPNTLNSTSTSQVKR
ncbi:MAG: hypothetical protein QMD86_02550 [Patescibacteria group bacterium]|nr:hypothetical protein [Patescibacteria group bacterium]